MSEEITKAEIFRETERTLTQAGFSITARDETRPWGGFFVIDEAQTAKFAATYFAGSDDQQLKTGSKLSPKFLMVAPQKRLSWQYHHRRSEIWKVVAGLVGVVTSDTDQEGEVKEYAPGSLITLKNGERHRLVGLNEWGVIAEIWQHSDPANPSDENDIVRVQDDFGR